MAHLKIENDVFLVLALYWNIYECLMQFHADMPVKYKK